MRKTYLSCLISGLLLIGLACPQVNAAPQGDKQASSVEKIKSDVAKLGVGAKAKATIRMKDGTKVKGYIGRADEENFVMRDRNTDAPTTVRYEDVAKVESNRGHSGARNVAIGVGAGVGATIAVLLIIIASLD